MMRLLGYVWASLGILDLIKSQFLSQKWQTKQVISYLPGWSWGTWVISWLVIFIVAVLEGAYRQHLKKETELEVSKKELEDSKPRFPKLLITIHEVFTIPSNTSDLFLRITAHNDSSVVTLIERYRVLVTVEGDQTYIIEGPFGDIPAYTLTKVDWADPTGRKIVSRTLLDGFDKALTRESPLRRGAPAGGWLHFRAECNLGLPPLTTNAIKSLNLVVYDAFSKLHTARKESPVADPTTLISQTGVAL